MAKPSGQEARNIYARAVASANAGDRTTAIKLFEQLIGSDAPQVQVRSALVRLNLDAHAWTQAADHMIALVPLIPSPAQLLADAADTYSRAGAFDKAHETYEHLHRAMPDYATGYFNHAYMLRTAHRFDEALAYYDKALAHGIDGPEEVWLNKAVIYSDHLRDDGAAAACLATALDIKADYVPALLNRANLYEEMSDRDGARESYRRVVELDPHNTTAVARLINLDAGEVTSPIRTTAQKMANHSGIQARARSSLNFALGRDADARGDYDTAFEYFRMANETAKPLGPAYDRAASETFTQDLITQFSKDWFNKLPVYSDATPVFICGMFRSGSTLTEQVIAAHPDATPGGELEYFIALATRELAPFPAAVRGTKPDKMREMARHYLQLLAKRFPGGGLITDKRPDNFLYIGLIKTLFPNARFVHTTRDALDNCLSIYFLELADTLSYAKDLMDTGHFYAQQVSLMSHWKTLFPDDIFTMSYDAFVADPRTQAGKLLDFLGLEWNDACLEFHRLKNTVKTESYWQVRKPLYTQSSGRHLHYDTHIKDLASYLKTEGLT